MNGRVAAFGRVGDDGVPLQTLSNKSRVTRDHRSEASFARVKTEVLTVSDVETEPSRTCDIIVFIAGLHGAQEFSRAFRGFSHACMVREAFGLRALEPHPYGHK